MYPPVASKLKKCWTASAAAPRAQPVPSQSIAIGGAPGVADLVEQLPDRLDEMASEAHALAAEDDHLGIEDVDEVGDVAAEPLRRVFDHGAAPRVPLRRPRPRGRRCPCPRAEAIALGPALEQAEIGGPGLEAAVAAALAAPPALFEIVAELAGAAARAAMEAAVGDEPGADAAAERDGGDAVPAAAVAEEVLRHGVGVGVVVDPDRHVEDVGEHRRDRHVAPAEALLLPADARSRHRPGRRPRARSR